MMATTHALSGLAAVAPVAFAVPELQTPLAVGALLGGLAPDLDVVFDHRRTLHFPYAAGLVAAPAAVIAVAVPAASFAGIAAFALAAWLHAASDAFGADPSIDPWREPSDRAVFDHLQGRWIRPRRWIRYDGAPEDAALAVGLAVPGWIAFDGWVEIAIVLGIAVSIAYALVRRRLVAWVSPSG